MVIGLWKVISHCVNFFFALFITKSLLPRGGVSFIHLSRTTSVNLPGPIRGMGNALKNYLIFIRQLTNKSSHFHIVDLHSLSSLLPLNILSFPLISFLTSIFVNPFNINNSATSLA